MAGHAPELQPVIRRMLRRLADLSDLRISVYMFVLAVVIAVVLFMVDRRFFG